MIKIIFTAIFIVFGFYISFYSLRFPGIDGQEIIFNNFQGKKVLIVNIASDNENVNQLIELEQLYQQYKDSFIIVAFPSNSFGHEPKTNSEIKSDLQQTLGLTFPIAEKSSVVGSNANTVYKWLANKIQNDKMSSVPLGDFQKYLINKRGSLVGVFDSSVNPLNPTLINAVRFQ